MNTYADKTQENKSQSAANAISQKQRSGESTFKFVDNRPEAVAQRKPQEMANNSQQVSQLKAFQVMVSNSPQAQQHRRTTPSDTKHGIIQLVVDVENERRKRKAMLVSRGVNRMRPDILKDKHKKPPINEPTGNKPPINEPKDNQEEDSLDKWFNTK